ncbi:putative transposase-like protein [Nymphon striatum]|nr:putative transposase-like protein [Nymphon striatum]
MPRGISAPTQIVDEVLPMSYLEGLTMTMRKLAELTPNTFETIKLLASWGILKNEKNCDNCHIKMSLQERRSHRYIDGYVWVCRRCKVHVNIRSGSFFEGSHLQIKQLLDIIHSWSNSTPQIVAKRECTIGSWSTMVKWFNFIRGICERCLIEHPIHIGGPGMVVEIDESKFFHRKYHRGRWTDGHWVLGMIERGTNQCALVVVQDRKAETLLPLIQEFVLPRTTVITDGWAAYNHLQTLQYNHSVVNHSLNFVDPNDPSVHTNTVEGSWANCKTKFKQMHGTYEAYFESALGIVDKLFTGPLWRQIETVTHILDLNEVWFTFLGYMERFSKDPSELFSGVIMYPNFTVVDEVFNSLFNVNDDELDVLTLEALQILYFEHLQSVSSTVSTTNMVSERDFANLDRLRREKPHANTIALEGVILFSNNKTLEWLDALDFDKKKKMFEAARTSAPKMIEGFKERKRILKQKHIELLHKKRVDILNLERKKTEEISKINKDIKAFGVNCEVTVNNISNSSKIDSDLSTSSQPKKRKQSVHDDGQGTNHTLLSDPSKHIYKNGQMAAIAYNDCWYPGQVMKVILENKALVKFLHPCESHKSSCFRWPNKEDILEIENVFVFSTEFELCAKDSSGRSWFIPNVSDLHTAYKAYHNFNCDMDLVDWCRTTIKREPKVEIEDYSEAASSPDWLSLEIKTIKEENENSAGGMIDLCDGSPQEIVAEHKVIDEGALTSSMWSLQASHLIIELILNVVHPRVMELFVLSIII